MPIDTRHLFASAAVLAVGSLSPAPGYTASHREAPLISLDAAADITDVYAFRSWNDPDRVVLIMNVIPGQEPSSGPNYWNFDDNVLYAIHVDVNGDGDADDLVYEFEFTTEVRGVSEQNGFTQAFLGAADAPGVLPPITALDGPGSEGLSLRQTYVVTEVRGNQRRELGVEPMVVVPSNVGPRTMPDYEDLADQGIYDLVNGGRVFTGQRDETFYIDLGAVFDTVNLRGSPILSLAEDTNDFANPFGVDHFSGFNINTIAIEVPIAEIVGDPDALIGVYASTSRNLITRRKGDPFRVVNDQQLVRGFGRPVQVARMANPLINELLISLERKDIWNATDPVREAAFIDFFRNPRLVAQLNALFGTAFPENGRDDLVAALLKYPGQDPAICSSGNPCSELLRLDLAVEPVVPGGQRRLGLLDGDFAGFPNGRRPNDDVVDIVLRVAAGALLGPVPALGDGVNFNIGAVGSDVTEGGIATRFPFLPTPFDGRDRRHIDCGEQDGNPCN